MNALDLKIKMAHIFTCNSYTTLGTEVKVEKNDNNTVCIVKSFENLTKLDTYVTSTRGGMSYIATLDWNTPTNTILKVIFWR